MIGVAAKSGLCGLDIRLLGLLSLKRSALGHSPLLPSGVSQTRTSTFPRVFDFSFYLLDCWDLFSDWQFARLLSLVNEAREILFDFVPFRRGDALWIRSHDSNGIEI